MAFRYDECPQSVGTTMDQSNSNKRLRGPILASLATSAGSFTIGAVLSWTSVAIPEFEKTPEDLGELTTDQKSWIGAMVPLGALIAGPLTGLAIEKFGRKKTLLGINLPLLIGWLLIIFAKGPSLVIAGRFFTGFAVGCLTLVIPVYITECTEERLRGAIASSFPIVWAVGFLFTNFAGWVKISWWWLSIINAVAPIVGFFCMLWVPESPVYFIRRGLDAEGRNAIKWLRGTSDAEAAKEYGTLSDSVQANDDGTGIKLRDFAKRAILKPTLISVALFVFQQFSGFNAVIFYMVSIFESTGSDMDPGLSSTLVCAVFLAGVLVTSAVTDKLGRRLLLIISTVGITISTTAMGLFFFLKFKNDNVTPDGLSWLPLVSLFTFMITFSFGMGPMPFLLMGEILPSHVKGVVSSIGISIMWFLAFLITKTFDDMAVELETHGCFWLFAGVSGVGIVFTVIFVKETKGKTMEQIYKLYS